MDPIPPCFKAMERDSALLGEQLRATEQRFRKLGHYYGPFASMGMVVTIETLMGLAREALGQGPPSEDGRKVVEAHRYGLFALELEAVSGWVLHVRAWLILEIEDGRKSWHSAREALRKGDS